MAWFTQVDEQGVASACAFVPDEQSHRGPEFLAESGIAGEWVPLIADMLPEFPHPVPEVHDDVVSVRLIDGEWTEEHRPLV